MNEMRWLWLLLFLLIPPLFAAPTNVYYEDFESTGGTYGCSDTTIGEDVSVQATTDNYISAHINPDDPLCSTDFARNGTQSFKSEATRDAARNTQDYRTQLVNYGDNALGSDVYFKKWGSDKTKTYWMGYSLYIPAGQVWTEASNSQFAISINDFHERKDSCDVISDQTFHLFLNYDETDSTLKYKTETAGQTGAGYGGNPIYCSDGKTQKFNTLGAVTFDKWEDFVIAITYGYNNDGELRVFKDGQLLVQRTNITLGFATDDGDEDFIKTGIYQSYCDGNGQCPDSTDRVIYFDDMTLATCPIGEDCFDTVDPARFDSGSTYQSTGFPDGQFLERPQPDANGFRAIYERPFVGASDTCRSGWDCIQSRVPFGDGAGAEANCTGSSGVNPDDADEYIVKDCAGFANVNNYKRIFTCAVDCPTTDITLTASGVDGDERWLGWWNGASYSEITHPNDMADASRTQINDLIINGADFNVIDRLWIEGQISITDSSVSTDNIINRIQAPQSDAEDIVYIGIDNPRNYIQNSVLRGCTKTPGTEYAALKVRKGSHDTRLVRSQARNCYPNLSVPDGGATDYLDALTIEGNDFYTTSSTLCDGVSIGNTTGNCTCGGAAIVVNSPQSNTTSAEWLRIERNRFRYFYAADNACAGSVDKGGAILASGNANYGLVRRNIIEDSVALFRNETGSSLTNWSFIQNIGHNITDLSGGETSYFIDGDLLENWEAYFNLCHTCDSPVNRGGKGEFKGNVLISNGALAGSWGAGGVEDYNVYVQSIAGSDSNVLEYTSAAWVPVFDDYTYTRVLITFPELSTIADVIPSSSAPEAYKTFVTDSNLNPGAGLGVE